MAGSMNSVLTVALLVVAAACVTHGLECYLCTSTTSDDKCGQTIDASHSLVMKQTCGTGESCGTTKTGAVWGRACIPSCQNTATGDNFLECCTSDLCNGNYSGANTVKVGGVVMLCGLVTYLLAMG